MSRRLVPLAVLFLVLAAGCGDDDDEESSQAKTQTSRSAGCTPAKPPAPKREGAERRPTAKLDPGKTYEVTFTTNCGAFTIRLDQKASPATAASFAALAKDGFFDDTVFHRIVPGFVIQGGDPTGTGTGGPGYSTVDRPPADAAYTTGVVAMAKTAQEAPGTSGSQFYVVTGQDAQLPPEYALLGKVVKGIEVTQEIGELGDPASGGSGTPTQPVVLEKATVRERP